MPLYSFRCESCESEQDLICRYSNRPDAVECAECAGSAKYVIRMSKAQSSDVFYHADYKSDGPTLSMHKYKCNACSHGFEAIIDRRDDEKYDSDQECPKCSAVDSRWVPSVRIDRWSERFPYYDRGLGVMLQSKAHRAQICKERGLTPVDGDWDLESEFRKMDDENEKDERDYSDYCDRLDNAPAFSSYRQARDRGMI